MISKETCVKIWNCYNEIDKAEKIIKDMAETLADDEEKNTPTLNNVFGEQRGLQLGVPSGSSSYTLFGVNVELSVKIIEKHVEEKKRRLEELMAIAQIELKG